MVVGHRSSLGFYDLELLIGVDRSFFSILLLPTLKMTVLDNQVFLHSNK